MGQIFYPETSVIDYQSALRNTSEGGRSHLPCDERLKSLNISYINNILILSLVETLSGFSFIQIR